MTALSFKWGVSSQVYLRDGGSSTQDTFKLSRASDVSGTSVALKEGESATSEYAATIKKLKSFRSISSNWDGYSAEKPSQKAIDKAIKFVEHLGEWEQPVYFVAPGPNGEILVELKNSNRTIEVFFQPDGQHEYVMFEGEKALEEDTFALEITPHLLDWLHEHSNAGNH